MELTIDLGQTVELKGFAYTPQKRNAEGMMAKGIVWTSLDGQSWTRAGSFEFGNLVNDPTRRFFYFQQPQRAKLVRVQATEIANNGKTVSVAEVDFL